MIDIYAIKNKPHPVQDFEPRKPIWIRFAFAYPPLAAPTEKFIDDRHRVCSSTDEDFIDYIYCGA